MIYKIKGSAEKISDNEVVVNTSGGISYLLNTTKKTALFVECNENNIFEFYTHFKVSEKDQKLYGFLMKDEIGFFNKVVNVSGGSKYATNLIDYFDTIQMAKLAIFNKDINSLKKVKGLGEKSAEELTIKLKFKPEELKSIESEVYIQSKEVEKILNTLEGLGIKNNDSNFIEKIKSLIKSGLDDKEIIKQILKES